MEPCYNGTWLYQEIQGQWLIDETMKWYNIGAAIGFSYILPNAALL